MAFYGSAGVWARHPEVWEYVVGRRRAGLVPSAIAAEVNARWPQLKVTIGMVDTRLRRAGIVPDPADPLSALITPAGGFATPVTAPPLHVHPKGWEPRFEQTGNTGVGVSKPTDRTIGNNPSRDDESWLIEGWGLSADQWRIVGTLNAMRHEGVFRVESQAGCRCTPKIDERHNEARWLHYYKANLERVDPVREAETERLCDEIRTHVPVPFAPLRGDDALVIAIADSQMGKGDAGGSARAAANFLRSMDRFEERIAALWREGKAHGTLYVLGMGDIIEQCFAGETAVVTRTGIRQIRDLAADGKAVLKTRYGAWVESEVRSFGTQALLKITLSRGGATKELFATAGHRWLCLANPSRNAGVVDKTTDALAPGDMLVSNFGKHPDHVSPIGVMAGYVFGDGHRYSGDPQHGCAVNVHRPDFGMLPYFAGHPQSSVREHRQTALRTTRESDRVQVSALPSFFKELPPLTESLPYLLGWAAGYFAADGCVSRTVSLSSSRRAHLEHFAAVCSRIGIGTNPITSWERVGCGTVPTRLYRISMVASTIPDSFFVHPDKLAKFRALVGSRTSGSSYTFQKNRARNWRVSSVAPTDRVEEVFCAVVPDTHSFTLANDILTGNCGSYYPQQAFRTDLNRRDQIKVMRRLILKAMERWAPLFDRVVVPVVGGNHGENRAEGKSYTDFADNDDVAIFEQVQEILAANPSTYGHVSFLIPNHELSLTLDMGGEIVGMTHGQVFGKGTAAQPGKRAIDWWMKQAHGQQPIGGARIMFSAHYHHLLVTEMGSKTHFQCPALESGSEWYTNQSGQSARAGMLTVRIGKNVSESGWADLEVV